ncbi:protein-export chaperone SecB [Marivibrio halodurans]|uniref:Protein-export chaperone SecB n=1 Tax=Marivibrio halodurans TaxID=2039722 RepID=A0A8J7S0N0_9PROT|nr:protein-export chaperone SecB [Marivibrio halodurans]MBP5858167.1 protein-export chaperone SecB [Marivibrio halodurans]
MSDDTANAPENGAQSANSQSGANPASDAQGGDATRREPPYRIHAQYVKDLSVENPRAPECFMDPQIRQARSQIEVDITTRSLGKRLAEVLVVATVKARIEPDTPNERLVYLVELSYGAAVEIGAVPEETVEPLLHVEVPRLLFPYIRQILSVASQDMGQNLLQVPVIDFLGLYRWKKQEGTIDGAVARQVAAETASGAPASV